MFSGIRVVRKILSQILRLSHSTIGRLSIGYIINLASNDVQRFDLVNRSVANNFYKSGF